MGVIMVKYKADDMGPLGDLTNLLKDLEPTHVNQVVDADKKAGTPIFSDENMYSSSHPLDQLIRFFLKDQHITEEEFKARHIQLHQLTSMPINKGGSERSNILRSLKSSNITWNAFERILNICGFDIVNVDIDIQARTTGEILHLSRKTIQENLLDELRPTLEQYTQSVDIRDQPTVISDIVKSNNK